MNGRKWTAGKGSESRVENHSQYDKNRSDINMEGREKKVGKIVKGRSGQVTRYVYK